LIFVLSRFFSNTIFVKQFTVNFVVVCVVVYVLATKKGKNEKTQKCCENERKTTAENAGKQQIIKVKLRALALSLLRRRREKGAFHAKSCRNFKAQAPHSFGCLK